jgi:hypothetical protein
MKYNRTNEVIAINNKNKYIYMLKNSNVKYVKHNKQYLTISQYKKNIIRGGHLKKLRNA